MEQEQCAAGEEAPLNRVSDPLWKTYDRENMYPDLDRIIKEHQINTLFQPIFNLSDHSIFAFEALSRAPKKSRLHMPELLFSVARKYQKLYELDCLCREQSIQNFSALNLHGKLTLNVDPYALVDPRFKRGRTLSLLKDAGIANNRIILELTEQSRTDCYDDLREAVIHYRDMGFAIALDDLSAGYSNLRLMAELEPEYIKLDKYFISRIDHNKTAYDFVALIVDLANRINCKVIAEGIETATELKAMHQLGVHYAQGYLLGMPEEHPRLSTPDILPKISNEILINTAMPEGNSVESLTLHAVPACSPDTPAAEVLTQFQTNPVLQAIPVIDDFKVVGVLTRGSVLQAFSTTFGHSLNNRVPAAKLMHAQPIVLQTDDLLTYASEVAMSRPSELIYTPIIVCDGTDYLGTASIRELLEKITQNQVKYARQCNPLTGLPGNISIENELDERLAQNRPFVCCYFDLDNFKAFNDHYGYERGDIMIGLVAKLLNTYKECDDFIGHIGGDDFIFISSRNDWEDSIRRCLNDFERSAPGLYDEQDRKAEGICAFSRTGETLKFPFSSLSVGALPCHGHRFTSRLDISAAIVELKHQAKKQAGNSLVIERRK